MTEIDIGWVDSWQIRDRKDVHPSHETQIIVIKDLVKWLQEQYGGWDNVGYIIEGILKLAKENE